MCVREKELKAVWVPNKSNFGGTADESSDASRNATRDQSGDEVGGSMLGHLIAKHLKESESRSRVEDLSQHARPKALVQTTESLLTKRAGDELREGGGREVGGDGEVHAHRRRVDGVHDAPPRDAPHARGEEVEVQRQGTVGHRSVRRDRVKLREYQ